MQCLSKYTIPCRAGAYAPTNLVRLGSPGDPGKLVPPPKTNDTCELRGYRNNKYIILSEAKDPIELLPDFIEEILR